MPIISNFPGGSLPEGKSGQFVGFNPAGTPVAKNVTAQDVAFTDGETFQTKYDSGKLTGPAGKDGAIGPAGSPGPAGKNATVNGVNALTVNATGGLKGSQSGSTYTLDGAGLRPKGKTYTLTTTGWTKEPTASGTVFTKTLTVPGVLADESKQLIMPMPASDSRDAYTAAGISCTGQSANSLTFKCQTVPTKAITVYIAIQEVAQA